MQKVAWRVLAVTNFVPRVPRVIPKLRNNLVRLCKHNSMPYERMRDYEKECSTLSVSPDQLSVKSVSTLPGCSREELPAQSKDQLLELSS